MRPPRPRRAVDIAPTQQEIAEGREGYVQVETTAYGRRVTETRDRVLAPLFKTAPAHVRVSGSVTRNLGDYNSAKVEVSVQLPCYPVEEEVMSTYNYASSLVDRLIDRELSLAVPGHQPKY